MRSCVRLGRKADARATAQAILNWGDTAYDNEAAAIIAKY
jgi:hypothetical protein